ncbi:MAG: VOC family protein [Chloroflexi bacterium]|nr:VOC family protein [Chloroflexota bacterium]OJV92328.1 MAG: glyoxalase [Chloroflexi bacterium 54-19]
MATRIQVTFDSNDPARLAEFWEAAMGYKTEDPPPGFATWEEFLASINVPAGEFDGASLVDPDGVGPRFFFQKVPEGKTAKNRLHLDLAVSGGRGVPLELREQRVRAEAARLTALGAKVQWINIENNHFAIVMQDPEGNEFCLH